MRQFTLAGWLALALLMTIGGESIAALQVNDALTVLGRYKATSGATLDSINWTASDTGNQGPFVAQYFDSQLSTPGYVKFITYCTQVTEHITFDLPNVVVGLAAQNNDGYKLTAYASWVYKKYNEWDELDGFGANTKLYFDAIQAAIWAGMVYTTNTSLLTSADIGGASSEYNNALNYYGPGSGIAGFHGKAFQDGDANPANDWQYTLGLLGISIAQYEALFLPNATTYVYAQDEIIQLERSGQVQQDQIFLAPSNIGDGDIPEPSTLVIFGGLASIALGFTWLRRRAAAK